MLVGLITNLNDFMNSEYGSDFDTGPLFAWAYASIGAFAISAIYFLTMCCKLDTDIKFLKQQIEQQKKGSLQANDTQTSHE